MALFFSLLLSTEVRESHGGFFGRSDCGRRPQSAVPRRHRMPRSAAAIERAEAGTALLAREGGSGICPALIPSGVFTYAVVPSRRVDA
jgi:hypothetical protein